MQMKNHQILIAVPLIVGLAACSSDSDYSFEENKDNLDAQIVANSAPQALFSPDPEAPVLPFPNSLFFQGSLDGTLNIPGAADENDTGNPVVALNQMDGFSTVAPISTMMSEPLAQSSLQLGSTVRVFEVQTQGGIAVTNIDAELTDPVLAPRAVGSQLVLLPVVPLKAKTDYLVVLTNGITDVDDNALTASLVYDVLKEDTVLTNPPALEGLRQATLSHLGALQRFDETDGESVVLSWVFRTQSITDVLQATRDQSDPAALLFGQTPSNTGSEGIGGQGKADIYIGSLALPYYLAEPGEGGNPAPVLGGFWTNSDGNVVGAVNESGAPNYAPMLKSTQTVPVIMTVPNASSASGGNMPEGGWPVTIFQHGITRNRLDTLTIADAMADVGRVVIGIDMPLHGVTDADSPLHANQSPLGVRERTFDLDIAVNPPADGEEADPNAPESGPDGKIDASGGYFLNLSSLPTGRDNVRQAIADLFVLGASVDGAQVEGVSLNSGNMTFYGQSLGAIVGTSALSFETRYSAASLAVPGGGIAQLLRNSESFGPRVNGTLAEQGVLEGSDDYNTFFIAAQTLLDSGDPINHASTLGQSASTGLHMIEVIGDSVIPNEVATAPLSGTKPLARQMGLTQTAESTTNNSLVRFSEGDHGSILGSPASLAATVEMQRQVALFALSMGGQLTVTDTSVIQAVPEED